MIYASREEVAYIRDTRGCSLREAHFRAERNQVETLINEVQDEKLRDILSWFLERTTPTGD